MIGGFYPDVPADGGHFWGDPNAPEIWGDPGDDTGWGWF